MASAAGGGCIWIPSCGGIVAEAQAEDEQKMALSVIGVSFDHLI